MPVITPNRVAAATTWTVGLSTFVYGIVGTFPHSWQSTALVVAGLLTKVATTLKFLQGSQNWDSIKAYAELPQVADAANPVEKVVAEAEKAVVDPEADALAKEVNAASVV